jgi:hypothetical protein
MGECGSAMSVHITTDQGLIAADAPLSLEFLFDIAQPYDRTSPRSDAVG